MLIIMFYCPESQSRSTPPSHPATSTPSYVILFLRSPVIWPDSLKYAAGMWSVDRAKTRIAGNLNHSPADSQT